MWPISGYKHLGYLLTNMRVIGYDSNLVIIKLLSYKSDNRLLAPKMFNLLR